MTGLQPYPSGIREGLHSRGAMAGARAVIPAIKAFKSSYFPERSFRRDRNMAC
jgi:hypothetical protein